MSGKFFQGKALSQKGRREKVLGKKGNGEVTFAPVFEKRG